MLGANGSAGPSYQYADDTMSSSRARVSAT
jgi:hypothetical protein